jgi:hypothetical protein
MKFKISLKITHVNLISLNHQTSANRNSGTILPNLPNKRKLNSNLNLKIVSKHLNKKTMSRISTITLMNSFQTARVRLLVDSVIYQIQSKMTRLKDHTIRLSIMIQ